MAILKIIIELVLGRQKMHAVREKQTQRMRKKKKKNGRIKFINRISSRVDGTCLRNAAPQPQQGERTRKSLRAL